MKWSKHCRAKRGETNRYNNVVSFSHVFFFFFFALDSSAFSIFCNMFEFQKPKKKGVTRELVKKKKKKKAKINSATALNVEINWIAIIVCTFIELARRDDVSHWHSNWNKIFLFIVCFFSLPSSSFIRHMALNSVADEHKPIMNSIYAIILYFFFVFCFFHFEDISFHVILFI